MKTLLVVYHSMTGGSRQMAEAAAAAATRAGAAVAAEAAQEAGAAVVAGTGDPGATGAALHVCLLRAVDALIQDWKYWGDKPWSSMQWDPKVFPDPEGPSKVTNSPF